MKKILAAAVAVLISVAPLQAGDKLTPSELKQLAPGRYAVNVMGLVTMTVSLRPNGTLSGQANGERDTGRWHVRGQKLCVAWNSWYDGKQRCASLSGGNGTYAGGGLVMRRI